MGPTLDPVDSDETLPKRVEVVVVGGGIIGASAAFWLARAGVPVALCEKGAIAGEQSSRNWGWCRQTMRDPKEIPLAMAALRLWPEMNESVEAETGFRRTGILFAAEDEAELAPLETWLKDAQPYKVDARLVTGDALAALLPGIARPMKGGVFTGSDGRAEPQKAAPAIARAAQRAGAAVLTGCAVRAVETEGGRVAGVVTEKGPIACDAVLLAGGAWSRLFCDGLDLRLPQLKVIATAMRTEPLEGPCDHPVWTGDFAFRKRLDGGYTIATSGVHRHDIKPESFRFLGDFWPTLRREWRSTQPHFGASFFRELATPRRPDASHPGPYEATRTIDPEPSEATNRRTKDALDRAFPVFRQARIAQTWAGSIDVTPDALPVISPVEAVPGFYLATGFSGHGFGIGPAAGRLAADLVMGAAPLVDPAPFRFERFVKGARLSPYGGP